MGQSLLSSTPQARALQQPQAVLQTATSPSRSRVPFQPGWPVPGRSAGSDSGSLAPFWKVLGGSLTRLPQPMVLRDLPLTRVWALLTFEAPDSPGPPCTGATAARFDLQCCLATLEGFFFFLSTSDRTPAFSRRLCMSGRWIWRGGPQALVRLGWGTSCGAPGSQDAQLLGSSWHHGIARAGWYRERPRRRGPVGGGRESWEEGLTKSLQQAQLWCSSEGGRGQGRGALGTWPQLSPPVVGKRGGRKLAQGLGDRQGLSQTPKGQWREGEGRHHATLPILTPAADTTNRDYIFGIILSSPSKPRPNLRSSAQPPPATPDSSGLRHFVIQLPALV